MNDAEPPRVPEAGRTPPMERLGRLVLEGTPKERGRIHGESLRDEIREMVALQERVAVEAGADPSTLVHRLVDETGFLEAARKWTPQVVEEIRGIAEAAGIDFKRAFALNLVDEADWVFEVPNWTGAGRCSVIGAAKDAEHPTVVAQNADMGPDYDGYQTLLHVKHEDSDLEELLLTVPGVTGIWGLNSCSIGLCLTEMTTKLNPSSRGLPTVLVARGALARRSLDEAVGFVKAVPHASGESYTIGSTDRVVCLEASANRVSRFIPDGGPSLVYHTNHPLENDDRWLSADRPEGIAPGFRERFAFGLEDSRTRFEALEKRMGAESKAVTIDMIKTVLRSHDPSEHPICRHDETGNITTFAVIMDLSDKPELHVTVGPPCEAPFNTFGF